MTMTDQRGRPPRGRFRRGLLPSLALWGFGVLSAQCAPVVKRDLSSLPPGNVGFEDMCDLQAYFDRLTMKVGTAPRVVTSAELEGKTRRFGRSRFAFETDFQLQAVRSLLKENWKRLPPELATTQPLEIEVQWSERSGLRRVVTDADAELVVGQERMALPYHVCLSDFLFGAGLYHQRRELLGLAPLPLPSAKPSPSVTDGGVQDAGVPDAARVDLSATGQE